METFTDHDHIERIIHAEHWDPYEVLGMHRIEQDGRQKIIVRYFHPRAAELTVLVDGKEVPMQKIRDAGFFIAVLDREEFCPYRIRIRNYEGHAWEQEDPYRFGPVISEFDMHLFGEGNQHNAYRMLGAHLMEHQGVAGVHFAVWAPSAKRVSVIGNFNHWDGRENAMRIRGSSGIWETFIPGLTQGEIYKFEIKTQEGTLLEKADPYGFAMEMRPRTGSVVWNIDSYSWSDADSAWIEQRDSKDPLADPAAIYEVHLGSWMKTMEDGFLSYHDLAEKLADYVLEMGFTHVELLPVSEHPLDASWGYQVTGYFAPTSRFGSPDDFKAFVDHLHSRGIGIILDWVPAHFPTDPHGLGYFDGTALYEHSDPRKGFHMDWKTLIFNYGRNEVRNFLISNALFWIDHYHLDGLRVDAVASMLYLDYGRNDGEWIPNQYGGRENIEAVEFLKQMNAVVYSYHRGVMTVAEESTAWPAVSRPTHLGGLGFGLKWNMGWMNDFLRYIAKDPVYRKYHHSELTFSFLYAFSENYVLVLSHDEVVHGKRSLVDKMPGDSWQKFANLRLALAYMYGHPGKKLLFQGCEFGQWHEWKFQSSLDWHLLDFDDHRQAQRFVRDLNRVYQHYPALHRNDFGPEGFQWVDAHDWESCILCFLRRGNRPEEVMLVVCNFTPVVRHGYRVGVPLHAHWDEVLNSDAGIYGGSNVGNYGGFWSEEISWQGQPCSLNLTLPPLSVSFFAPRIAVEASATETAAAAETPAEASEPKPAKKSTVRKTAAKKTAAKKSTAAKKPAKKQE